jgi:hypothetical protein
LTVKEAWWDCVAAPVLAWQRDWRTEAGRAAGGEGGGGGMYGHEEEEDDGDNNGINDCSLSTSSSSISSSSSSSSSSSCIEEEAKRKLNAFLSKPSELAWDDLVRSLCYENKVLWYLHMVLTYQSHVTPIVIHHRYL